MTARHQKKATGGLVFCGESKVTIEEINSIAFQVTKVDSQDIHGLWIDKDGNISVSLPKGADYKLLSAKESAKVEKAIVKTIAVEKKSAAVKEGKSTKIQMSSKLNMDNVKKITYTTTKKSIATVNKNGKISAKKKGTVTVKATVTLKNGKKKTVSMKITVK